jgi:hypothetical protein
MPVQPNKEMLFLGSAGAVSSSRPYFCSAFRLGGVKDDPKGHGTAARQRL